MLSSLAGERTAEYTAGYPCTTAPDSPLDHLDRKDFSQAGAVARYTRLPGDSTGLGCTGLPVRTPGSAPVWGAATAPRSTRCCGAGWCAGLVLII